MEYIGITERGDAALDTSWLNWVNKGKAAILITKNPIKLRDILFEKVPIFCYRNIINTFTSIQMLNSQDYKYGRAFYPSSTSLTFYKVTPSVEEFNESIASNYFDVDEVWRDELRGKI